MTLIRIELSRPIPRHEHLRLTVRRVDVVDLREDGDDVVVCSEADGVTETIRIHQSQCMRVYEYAEPKGAATTPAPAAQSFPQGKRRGK